MEDTTDLELYRAPVLSCIANLRSGLLKAAEPGPILARLDKFIDAVKSWGTLPELGRSFYCHPVLDTLFEIVADLEDESQLSHQARQVIEISLWDAAAELRLDRADEQNSRFIARHRDSLLLRLKDGAEGGVERLLYRWASLLRKRREKPLSSPVYADEARDVIDELLFLGLPRRAKSVALTFGLPIDPLIMFTLKHRPWEEESSRTEQLIYRIGAPPRPVPFFVLRVARVLQSILATPISRKQLHVSVGGTITIGRTAYGVTSRIY